MAGTTVKELTNRLEQGMMDFFSSEYVHYLKTMSLFHQYSTRNTLLIHMQMPEATHVAGFRTWQTKFERKVNKGAKGIRILAPLPVIIREQKEVLDADTRLPILDDDGMPMIEETEHRIARYKVTTVFDISQTEGKPLPTLVKNLTGDVEQYAAFMDALRLVSPLPIVIEPMPANTDGTCYFGNKISIREGMSETQTVCAIIHEITHAKLHDLSLTVENDENDKPKDNRTKEVEAESVSYVVCQAFSIDTGANSFGYIAEWSKGRELKELNASLDVIRKTAAELIDEIDKNFREIAAERDIVFAIGEEQPSITDYTQDSESIDAAFEIELVADTDSAGTESVMWQEGISENGLTVERDAILSEYAKAKNDLLIGAKVLMIPVFDEGKYNRTGKKIRVTVELPIGKYQIFSRDEYGEKPLYLLTASGRVERMSSFFRDVWDEQQSKWVSYRPTEAELDNAVLQIANRFENDMNDPAKWARFQDAAVVNRLDECEVHNAPIREQREKEDEAFWKEAKQEIEEEKRQKLEKYDTRVDEIAKAIANDERISVAYSPDAFDGKNPVLDLFKLYDINLPLKTQGWVNTGLVDIANGSYRYLKGKHKSNSRVFVEYLTKLIMAIKATPIDQKRAELERVEQEPTENTDLNLTSTDGRESQSGNIVPPKREKRSMVESKLYKKLEEMFPQIASGECRYLQLEAGEGMEPLSLEWIADDQISIMHTYIKNGDLMYDPMVTFEINNDAKTMTALSFEQSMPPLYQIVQQENGDGVSIDGNGGQYIEKGLRKSINEFSEQWFDNIKHVEYMPVRANIIIDDKETRITFDDSGKPILPMPEILKPDSEARSEGLKVEKPEATMHASLPYPTLSAAELNAYGYTESDMYALSGGLAVELFDKGCPIYLLYSDNTEVLAFDRDEIITFSEGGFCGITKADWEVSPMYAEQMAITARAEAKREAELLYGSGNRFGIFQVRDGNEHRDFRFASMSELNAQNLNIMRSNYELVYTEPFSERIEFLTDRYPVLNEIFDRFNAQLPEDYSGHSVSISDVIVLKHNGDFSAHYVDRFGFREIDDFLSDERQWTEVLKGDSERSQRASIKSNSQVGNTSTVAEIEADVKAGKTVSLHDLSNALSAESDNRKNSDTTWKDKPTLKEKLEIGKQKAALQGQSGTLTTNDREV